MDAVTTEAPPDLWAEDGEYLWLRADLADDATRARRIAFVGRDPQRNVVLPETYLGGARYGYDDIIVANEPVPLRPGEPDETGWAGSGADTWWRTEPDHPKAVLYWSITNG